MIRYKIEIIPALKKIGINTTTAKISGIFGQDTMKKFRKGDTNISLEVLNRLCCVLELQPSDIIEYVETDDDKEKRRKSGITASEEDAMFNTIILKKGYACLTDQEYKSFTKGDTICGADREPVELMRWSIEDIEEAKKVLAEHRCRYTHWNVWDIEEYGLEYCRCDEDGTFIEGSDFDFAEEA